MNKGNEMCLLLNNNYTIIKTISWQVAMKLIFSQKVAVVEEYERYITHPTVRIRVPAVVSLKRYYDLYRHYKVKFTSDNLYARDNYTCAYCGEKKNKKDLSKDHIIPRSHFKDKKISSIKETSWQNVITACKNCNSRKGGRTPYEAGMTLRFKPTDPRAAIISLRAHNIPSEWVPYISA